MKPLIQFLENKFLIKKNINDNDTTFEVYKNVNGDLHWVKIVNIQQFDILTKDNGDFINKSGLKERLETDVLNKGLVVVIAPAQTRIDWNYIYDRDFKTKYKKTNIVITSDEFNYEYWSKYIDKP